MTVTNTTLEYHPADDDGDATNPTPLGRRLPPELEGRVAGDNPYAAADGDTAPSQPLPKRYDITVTPITTGWQPSAASRAAAVARLITELEQEIDAGGDTLPDTDTPSPSPFLAPCWNCGAAPRVTAASLLCAGCGGGGVA